MQIHHVRVSRAGFEQATRSIKKLVRVVDRKKTTRIKAQTIHFSDHFRIADRPRRIRRSVLTVCPAGQNNDMRGPVGRHIREYGARSESNFLISPTFSRLIGLSQSHRRRAAADHTRWFDGFRRCRPFAKSLAKFAFRDPANASEPRFWTE